MRPVDPRLVRRAPAVRRLLAGATVLAGASAVAIVVQAIAVADLLAAALGTDRTPGFTAELCWLAAAIVVRAAAAWGSEELAGRAAGSAAGQLRQQVLAAVAGRGSRWRAGASAPGLQPLFGAGLDGMHSYLGRYLPALVQAAVVPVAMLAVLVAVDPLSALIAALTLPLIPLFMALIGWYTAATTTQSLASVGRLAGRFADVVAGLPELVVLRRVGSLARSVRESATAHRQAAGKTLRVAFLSSMVLELFATLSVALVAVSCGLRLVGGGIDVRTALIVLLLAPEAYLPLRAVGARFHAAADGAAAVTQALQILDRPTTVAGHRTDLAALPALRLAGVALTFPDGRQLTLPDCEFPASVVSAVSGRSGSGKTTMLNLLVGLDSPDTGRVLVTGADGSEISLTQVDLPSWRHLIGWCGQRGGLLPETLRRNLTGGRPVPADTLAEVLRACALDELIADLPDGLDTVVGPAGRALSTGQRRRVGLARALLDDAAVLLLDEPTEGLDAATEAAVLQGIRPLLAGRTVVVTTHRPAVLALAERHLDLGGVSAASRSLRIPALVS